MPSFVINTNISRAGIPTNYLKELTSLVSQLLGKPEKYVTVRISSDQWMTWEGSSEPCAVCHLESIGRIGKEENYVNSKALMDKISQDLKIPKDRMYIFYYDCTRDNVGYNGTTFACLDRA